MHMQAIIATSGTDPLLFSAFPSALGLLPPAKQPGPLPLHIPQPEDACSPLELEDYEGTFCMHAVHTQVPSMGGANDKLEAIAAAQTFLTDWRACCTADFLPGAGKEGMMCMHVLQGLRCW